MYRVKSFLLSPEVLSSEWSQWVLDLLDLHFELENYQLFSFGISFKAFCIRLLECRMIPQMGWTGFTSCALLHIQCLISNQNEQNILIRTRLKFLLTWLYKANMKFGRLLCAAQCLLIVQWLMQRTHSLRQDNPDCRLQKDLFLSYSKFWVKR